MDKDKAQRFLDRLVEILEMQRQLDKEYEEFGIYTSVDNSIFVRGIERIADTLQLTREYHMYDDILFAHVSYKGFVFFEGVHA